MDEKLSKDILRSLSTEGEEENLSMAKASRSSRGMSSNATPTTNYKTHEETSWIERVRDYINFVDPKPISPCTIFKVPDHIRKLDPDAYTPVVAPLGPFHHRNPYETSVAQLHKWQSVHYLLLHHGSPELLDKCLLELKEQDDRVRSCYSEKFPAVSPEKMALIMLLDGCFIIYLMLLRRKKSMEEITMEEEKEIGEIWMLELVAETTKEDEGKKMRKCETENGGEEVVSNILKEDKQLEGPAVNLPTLFLVVSRDLLKLENQIPFFIIQLLFKQLQTRNDGNIDLVDLALELFKDMHPNESRSFKKQHPTDYHHLLHLFYSSRIPSEMPAEPTSAAGCFCIAMERIYSKWKEVEPAPPMDWASSPRWTPSATELSRAGVKFKKKELADSFLNITFGRRMMKCTPLLCFLKFMCLTFKSGRMEIPPLKIYSYTSALFGNLIAFEQGYVSTQMYFSIYAILMDCIIDQAEDVRLLRLEGILEHHQKNDEVLAELFGQLGSQIQFFQKTKYLTHHIGRVIEEVNKFYESKWHNWLARLRRDYLSNPWAIISVLAAIILLLLTIEQATFSALSYFHS